MEEKANTYTAGFGLENTLSQNNPNEINTGLINIYRRENIFLKKYIEIINTEIRKHLKLDSIPSLEEIAKKKLSNENDLISQETIDDWFNRLFKVEHIEPLSLLYETYIKNLQEELNYKTQKIKEYKKTLTTIVNENNDLRDTIQNLEEQLKNTYEVKINTEDNSSVIVMDRDCVMKVEERCRLLSRENEILTINFNKLQNENYELKMSNNSAYVDQRNNQSEEIKKLYLQSKEENENLQKQLEINKQKIFELTDKNINLEDQNSNLKYELTSVKEAYQRFNNNFMQKDD